MDIVRPPREKHLDEMVRLCNSEFSGEQSYTDCTWKDFLKDITTPEGASVSDEEWLEHYLPLCSLYLVDDDRLLGFTLFNTLGFSGQDREFFTQQLRASVELRESGILAPETEKALTENVIHYCSSSSGIAIPAVDIALPEGTRTVDALSEEDPYLFYIAVQEDCRGKGLGQMLLDETCRELADRGHKRIFSHAANPASVRIHARAGFEPLLFINPYYASLDSTTFMAKDLKEGSA